MGPLFAELGPPSDPVRRREIITAIHSEASRYREEIRIHYHLSEPDVMEPSRAEDLARLQEALTRCSTDLAFDRPKQSIRLGSGLHRGDSAVLSIVGIRLPHFIRQLGIAPLHHAMVMKKLGSLTRFAKAAGHARHEFLRRTGSPAFLEGFFLDRAVTVIVPLGLERAARLALGPSCGHEEVFAFAEGLLTTIRDTLEHDRSRIMKCRIDSPWSDAWMAAFRASESDLHDEDTCLGSQERSLLPRQQIRYAARLHHLIDGGSSRLSVEPKPSIEEWQQLLGLALRSGIRNLRWD